MTKISKIPASMAVINANPSTGNQSVAGFIVHVDNGGAGRIATRWLKIPLIGKSAGTMCVEYKGHFLPVDIDHATQTLHASTGNKVAEPMTVKGKDYRGIRVEEFETVLAGAGTVAVVNPTPAPAISLVPAAPAPKAGVTPEKALANARSGLRLATGSLAKDPGSKTAKKRVETAQAKVEAAEAAYFASVGQTKVQPKTVAATKLPTNKADIIKMIETLTASLAD